MTSGEKVLDILMANDDKALYSSISKLTDNQKDIVIASLVKTLKSYTAEAKFE